MYEISGASLKTANKLFSSIKNDYEMSFNANTKLKICHDDASNIPAVSFNFVPIKELTNLEKDSRVGKPLIPSVFIADNHHGFLLRCHRYCKISIRSVQHRHWDAQQKAQETGGSFSRSIQH